VNNVWFRNKNLNQLNLPTKPMNSLSCAQHIGRDSTGVRRPSPPVAHFVAVSGDRSGSMASMNGAPPVQIYEQIQDLAKTAKELNVPTYFTLVTFDDTIEVPIKDLNLLTDKLPTLGFLKTHMAPRGMTKLHDSGIYTLGLLKEQYGSYVASLSKKVQKLNPCIKTSYVLLTDGEDNSSAPNGEVRHNKVLKDMRRDCGTMAIFLGANIDAVKTGGGLGFNEGATIQMTPTFAGASQCLRAVSHTLRRASTGSHNQSVEIDDSQQQVNYSPPTTPNSSPPQMPGRVLLRRY
jgi:hypothetical protein